MNDTESSSPKAPKRRRHRALKIAFVIAVVLVALVLLLPAVASMGWVRAKVEQTASEALGTSVTIGDYSLGWFSGVAVDDLRIDNPPGFPQERHLFALASMRGDAGFLDLLFGRMSLEGTVTGLDLYVIQKEDGTTNVQALGGPKPAAPESGPPPAEKPQEPREVEASATFDLSELQLDLELRDSTIEIVHEKNGVLERMSNVHARVSKEYGTPVMRLEFEANLDRPEGGGESGKIKLLVDAEPDASKPVDANLTAIGLDLSRYRPLLASFFEPGQITAFAGVVDANTRVTGTPSELLTVDGSIEIDQPHFAGPLFSDMDVRAERFTLRPELTASLPQDGAPMKVDLSKVSGDLGFLTMKGLPTQDAADGGPARTGVEFDVDVAQLASFGGPMPEMLKDSGARVKGSLRAPLLADYMDAEPAEVVRLLGLDATLTVDRLAFVDQLLTGLQANLSLSDAKLKLDTKSATFDGGALTLTANVDASNLEQPGVDFDLGLQDADVGASAIAVLQYAVPLLAGLQEQVEAGSAVTFGSKVSTQVSFQGTAFPQEGQEVLAWLNEWTGQGNVALRDGQVQPAPELGNLLAFAGVQSKTLEFDRFATDFVLRQGFVETAQMKLNALGRDIGFQGRTSLGGKLDYTFDAKSLLAAHSDGQKVLKYLGDSPLGAKLVGTLDDPELGLPDLQQLLQQSVEGALQKEGQNLLEKILGGQKQDGEGQPKAPDPRSVIENILNPNKKKKEEPPK